MGENQVDWSWLAGEVEQAARNLLGCVLVSTVDGFTVRARIVETEAYSQDDPASHTFRGPTPRNQAMFLAAGHAYVYLSHGLHHCLNMVAGRAGQGAGVLVRAVEPVDGLDVMQARRGGRSGPVLANGPGKVGQALGVDLSLTGHDLTLPPLRLVRGALRQGETISVTPRIGISKAVDLPRRFLITGNAWVSKAR